eukprot:460665_1
MTRNTTQSTDNDNVKVAVRCRPLNRREKDLKCKYVIEVDSNNNQMVLNRPSSKQSCKSFRFDYVYGDDSSQKEVYADTAYPLVESVLEGYNGTIFAYGQTGCGKTWTMEGPNSKNPELQGIIPSSFQHIFDKVNSDSDPNTKFLIRAGYIEIYNEEIRDLLGKDAMKKLNLREDPEKGVYVQDLTMMTVKNVNDTQRLMNKGRTSRVVGRTNMNAVSSRSHAIFVLNVETSATVRLPPVDGKTVEETKIKAGKLNLVDLAGSERQSKTGAQGVRFKEATKINLSLSALGNVISALVEGKGKHIPYRDSKLTRLLQDSLGGNTKTVMIACVSPAGENYDETLSTLRYANRAKNIKNKPKINEDPKDALLKQYQDEIKRLKTMLKNNQMTIKPSQKTVTVKKEKARVVHAKKRKDEKLTQKYEELQAQYEQTKKENEEKLGQKKEENEVQYHDMMENIYLLESQLLDGGQGSNNAKQRLNDIKRRQQKQRSSVAADGNKKWKIKYRDAQNEIEDLMSEFEKQRSDLLQDIRMTHREMCLYRTIVYKLMAPNTIDHIIYESTWDAHKESWSLPPFMDHQSTAQPVHTNKYNPHLFVQPTPTIDKFDMMSVNCGDGFEYIEDKQDLNDDDLLHQMSKINDENAFQMIQNKEDIGVEENGEENLNFIHQLSTINDRECVSMNDKHADATNLMDIANLMIQDKQPVRSDMNTTQYDDDDDVLSQMMNSAHNKQNLFEQYKMNMASDTLQQKQDIKIDDFFEDINTNVANVDDDDDQYSVDVTELHRHLNTNV